MGDTALNVAVGNQCERAMGALARLGADVNIQGPRSGHTPLMHAVVDEQIEIARILLDQGALIDMVTTRERDTALMYAVIRDNAPLVELLVDRGANIRWINRHGQTALTLCRNRKIQRILIGALLASTRLSTPAAAAARRLRVG